MSINGGKKVIVVTGVMTLIMIATLFIGINFILSSAEKEQETYKAKIGKTIVLEKDTLTVIDYSMIMETFKLSNGQDVSASLVFNKK